MRRAALALLWTLVATCPVAAHAISGECRVRGHKVEVQAYFDDDAPAQNARVFVYDSQKKEVAQGRTDKEGRWTFSRPQPGKYEVVIDAGAGHRTTLKMAVSEEAPSAGSSGDSLPSETTPVLSEGPTREEFTRFPWQNLGIGLLVIAAASLAVFALVRRKVSDAS